MSNKIKNLTDCGSGRDFAMNKNLEKVLNMPRGNCPCGRWLMIAPTFTKGNPLKCECGRKFYVEEDKVICIPGLLMPALCLDLDGTIRYSKNGEFINHPNDVALFQGVEEKLWAYREMGFLIFGISNQAGVAYGYKTVLSNDAEIEATLQAFGRNPFHIVKCCFHHPGGILEPFNHRSLCRKPDIGLLAICEMEAFESGYIVDWDKSIFVGDRPEDEQTAINAKIAFIHADIFFGRRQN